MRKFFFVRQHDKDDRCCINSDMELCIGVNFTSSLRVDELKEYAREALDKLR